MEKDSRDVSRRQILLTLAGGAAVTSTRRVFAHPQNAGQKGKRSVDPRVPADVRGIIVEQLGSKAEDVRWESSFVNDLGADSLDTVELVMAFEEQFHIEIPDQDAEKLLRVGQLVEYLRKRRVLK